MILPGTQGILPGGGGLPAWALKGVRTSAGEHGECMKRSMKGHTLGPTRWRGGEDQTKSSRLLLDHPESDARSTVAHEHWEFMLSREVMRVTTTRRPIGGALYLGLQ